MAYVTTITSTEIEGLYTMSLLPLRAGPHWSRFKGPGGGVASLLSRFFLLVPVTDLTGQRACHERDSSSSLLCCVLPSQLGGHHEHLR